MHVVKNKSSLVSLSDKKGMENCVHVEFKMLICLGMLLEENLSGRIAEKFFVLST